MKCSFPASTLTSRTDVLSVYPNTNADKIHTDWTLVHWENRWTRWFLPGGEAWLVLFCSLQQVWQEERSDIWSSSLFWAKKSCCSGKKKKKRSVEGCSDRHRHQMAAESNRTTSQSQTTLKSWFSVNKKTSWKNALLCLFLQTGSLIIWG